MLWGYPLNILWNTLQSFKLIRVDLNPQRFFLEKFSSSSTIPDMSGVNTGQVWYSNFLVCSWNLVGCFHKVLWACVFFSRTCRRVTYLCIKKKKGARALTTHTHTPNLLEKYTRLLLRQKTTLPPQKEPYRLSTGSREELPWAFARLQ